MVSNGNHLKEVLIIKSAVYHQFLQQTVCENTWNTKNVVYLFGYIKNISYLMELFPLHVNIHLLFIAIIIYKILRPVCVREVLQFH